VAAMIPDIFCNFYLAKHHKFPNTSATTEAIEKISTFLEFLQFYKKKFDVCLNKFQNFQILQIKLAADF
jgi:hypothetical protein